MTHEIAEKQVLLVIRFIYIKNILNLPRDNAIKNVRFIQKALEGYRKFL